MPEAHSALRVIRAFVDSPGAMKERISGVWKLGQRDFMILGERQLVRKLGQLLRNNWGRIYVGKNISGCSTYMQDRFAEQMFVPQPEIDLVLEDLNNRLWAVEVKYFRNKTKYPFYSGIEQSLALLTFGFWSVGLWHFFERRAQSGTARMYPPLTQRLVRSLNLPISYSAFYAEESNSGIRVEPIFVVDKRYAVGAGQVRVTSPFVPIIDYVENPFRDTANAKRILDYVKKKLLVPAET